MHNARLLLLPCPFSLIIFLYVPVMSRRMYIRYRVLQRIYFVLYRLPMRACTYQYQQEMGNHTLSSPLSTSDIHSPRNEFLESIQVGKKDLNEQGQF